MTIFSILYLIPICSIQQPWAYKMLPNLNFLRKTFFNKIELAKPDFQIPFWIKTCFMLGRRWFFNNVHSVCPNCLSDTLWLNPKWITFVLWLVSYCQSFNDLCFVEKWVGPNNGITSFDNIGLAMLTVFQVGNKQTSKK